VCGKPNVAFEVASLNEDKIRKQKAIIAASSGNILVGVNGKAALQHLEEIGLTKTELATELGLFRLSLTTRTALTL